MMEGRVSLALRAVCGVGVLSLLALHQKVWDWSVVAPPVASRPEADQKPDDDKPPPLTLGAALPDTAPPRWPVAPVAVRVNAEPAPESPAATSGPSPGGLLAPGRSFVTCLAPAISPVEDGDLPAPHATRRFLSSLSHTGPPSA